MLFFSKLKSIHFDQVYLFTSFFLLFFPQKIFWCNVFGGKIFGVKKFKNFSVKNIAFFTCIKQVQNRKKSFQIAVFKNHILDLAPP